jgi:hypothetical protein
MFVKGLFGFDALAQDWEKLEQSFSICGGDLSHKLYDVVDKLETNDKIRNQ